MKVYVYSDYILEKELPWSHTIVQHGFKFSQCRLSVCITVCSEAEREREREREEAGVRVDNHERLAWNQLAGRPTLNQRHRRADLPSYRTLGNQRPRKRPNLLDGLPRLEGSAARQSNLGKPRSRQVWELAVAVQHTTCGWGPLRRTFLLSRPQH